MLTIWIRPVMEEKKRISISISATGSTEAGVDCSVSSS